MPQDDPQERDRTAMEVAEQCPLSDDARALLSPDLVSGKYIALLISQKKYADAIRFTAFTLPKQDAIWWGTLCLWDGCRTERDDMLPKPVGAVFETLIAWLQEPSEAKRRAVESAGRAAGITTPHGQLAMATFFSEGSMSAPDQPEVLPDPWLTAKSVASVVLAASKKRKPLNVVASQRAFLVLAADLTKGKIPWALHKEEEPAAPTVRNKSTNTPNGR